jgi:EF hand
MKTFNILMATILWIPLMGFAQTAPPSNASKATAAPRSFVVIDKNNDGHISREEATQAGVSNLNFDSADKNKDGKLNLSEWTLIKF